MLEDPITKFDYGLGGPDSGPLPAANIVNQPQKGYRAFFYAGDNYLSAFEQLRPVLVYLNHKYGGDAAEGIEYSTEKSLDTHQTNGAMILRNTRDKNIGFFTFQVMELTLPRDMFGRSIFRFRNSRVPVLHMVTFGVDGDNRGYNWAGKMVEMTIEDVQREGMDLQFAFGMTHKGITMRALERPSRLGRLFPHRSPSFYKGHFVEQRVMSASLENLGFSRYLDPNTGLDTGLLRGLHGKSLEGNHTDSTHPYVRELDEITRLIGANKDNGDSIFLLQRIIPGVPRYNVEGEDYPILQTLPVQGFESRPLVGRLSHLFSRVGLTSPMT